MSVIIEGDASCGLAEALNEFDKTFTNSSSRDSLDTFVVNDEGSNEKEHETSEPASPKTHPMAFTIDFGETKAVDKSRLEELAKKSQARHQRVQSMSASFTKPSPTAQKPPLSCKLPRKSQGYNSEGYFSSDQEDSILSGSFKLRQSPLAQTFDKPPAATINVKFKSHLADSVLKTPSKSPIVDSIMSRSDILPSRQSLNLPLNNTNSSLMRDVHKAPSCNNLYSYQPQGPMADIIDISPEGILLPDISSPELDILSPDMTSTPRLSPLYHKMSEQPDLLKNPLYIDDEVDRESNNSSTGTYVIECDNYTEEQKARMSIDRSLARELIDANPSLKSSERDPEIIYDYPKTTATESKRDLKLKSPLLHRKTLPIKENNVLEITCSYDSPDNELAAQTSKQIKSTRSYLEKIKNRVKNITEKSFSKTPPKCDDNADVGSFTSVTTSGIFSGKKVLTPQNHRRFSLSKSEIDTTDYVHRLSRETSVPVSFPNNFESTVLKNATKTLRENPDKMVGKLSNLSLNRCKGDKTWIQDWADSVKKFNNDSFGASEAEMNGTFCLDDKIPLSPRRECGLYATRHVPTKIPSPVGTLQRRTPDLIPQQETDSYLQKTQTAITNLQSKLHTSRPNIPPLMTSSLISEKALQSKLPVSHLSRSNSLNYRIKRSPQSSTEHNYPILETRKQSNDRNSNLSPDSDRLSSEKTLSNYNVNAILSPHRKHSRHHSFDGKNTPNFGNDLHNANSAVNLRTVLQNNALEFVKNDLTKRCHGDKGFHDRYVPNTLTMKRSSSYNAVSKNNNYMDHYDYNYGSDDSDTTYDKPRGYNPMDSPLKSIVPANSPRCPGTPEMKRKFGTGLARASVRVTSKERQFNSRLSEPPAPISERPQSNGHQSRKNDQSRQAVFNRLTKSRSSTRETSKCADKAPKKPVKTRPASKQAEITNWRRRASYDPLKAAQQGRKKATQHEAISPPSHSSPVHRSQSFHCNMEGHMGHTAGHLGHIEGHLGHIQGDTSDSDEHNDPMVTSTHSDMLHLRYQSPRTDKRSTFILDDITPTRENIDYIGFTESDTRTFILDSDTNSNTNESSPVPERVESESGSVPDQTDFQPRHKQRHSSAYSMSSSSTSLPKRQSVTARYLDISKYRAETSNNFLRRDPSKTYTGVLQNNKGGRKSQPDQKKQELEKWKRRSSYDPRKAAAQDKTRTVTSKPVSNVLRSQSFHGPMMATTSLRYLPQPRLVDEAYDQSSDNDF